MAKTIAYTIQSGDGGKAERLVEVNDEVAEFLEQDRLRRQAEKKRDIRHLSKSEFEQDRLPRRLLDRNGLENQVDQNLRHEVLHDVLATLSDQDRHLLHQYHWQRQTMEQISAELGISKMAVSKRLKKLYGALQGLVF